LEIPQNSKIASLVLENVRNTYVNPIERYVYEKPASRASKERQGVFWLLEILPKSPHLSLLVFFGSSIIRGDPVSSDSRSTAFAVVRSRNRGLLLGAGLGEVH